MKNTGKLLKDKRESAGLSISEVALATKINPKILTAIENGDTAALPAKTFLKGFLRSYALYLKMDADEVLRSYQEENGGPVPERVHEAYAKPAEGTPAATPTRRRMDEENSSGTRTIAIVTIVLLIGLIIGVRALIEKYQRERVVESSQAMKLSPLAQPPAEAAKPETKDAKAEEPASEPPETSESPAPAAPSPLSVPPAVVAPVAPTPSPIAKVEPPKEPVKEKAPEPAKAAEVAKPTAKSPEPAPASEKALAKKVKAEIILEALQKVDIKFQIKGQTKTVSLAPNEVHTIHTDEPVVFDFSDGGAVNIILNGKERGAPGDSGKPTQVTLP